MHYTDFIYHWINNYKVLADLISSGFYGLSSFECTFVVRLLSIRHNFTSSPPYFINNFGKSFASVKTLNVNHYKRLNPITSGRTVFDPQQQSADKVGVSRQTIVAFEEVFFYGDNTKL